MSDYSSQKYIVYIIRRLQLPYGLVVRIPAFHAGGPGSIPGVGNIFEYKTFLLIFGNKQKSFPHRESNPGRLRERQES